MNPKQSIGAGAQGDEVLYLPIDAGQIRLFTFDSKQLLTDEIGGRLRIVDLHDAATPSFYALSYTWDTDSESGSILCNSKSLPVRRNLYKALRRLRQLLPEASFWIDAICLNQDNEEEKLVQIKGMADIYSRAQRVWVWLGEETDETLEVIGLLPRVIAATPAIHEKSSNGSSVDAEAVNLPPPSSQVWSSIKTFASNQWFRRLWILQEAALACQIEFIWGSQIIQWDDLGSGLDPLVLEHIEGLTEVVKDLASLQWVFLIRNLVQSSAPVKKISEEDSLSLLATITELARNQQCSEPRDRVLGVLGLLREEQQEELAIAVDTSLHELYARFCKLLFRAPASRHSLCPLSYTWSEPCELGLPSWCPDYHHLPHRRVLNHLPLFKVSKMERIITESPVFSQLAFRGLEVDRIISVVAGSWHSLTNIEDSLYQHRAKSNLRWLEACLSLSKQDGQSDTNREDEAEKPLGGEDGGTPDHAKPSVDMEEDIPADHWRILVANHWKRKVGLMTQAGYVQLRAHLQAVSECAENDVSKQVLENDAENYLSSLEDWQRGRVYIKTRDGRLGLAPAGSLVGDIVVVLYGARVPHILRHEPEPHKYRLVGEAYVRGIMAGQAEEMGYEVQDFLLV